MMEKNSLLDTTAAKDNCKKRTAFPRRDTLYKTSASDSSHPSTLTVVWKFKSTSKVHVHYILSLSTSYDLPKIQTTQSFPDEQKLPSIGSAAISMQDTKR